MATLIGVVNVALEALGEPSVEAALTGTVAGDLAARVPDVAREALQEYPYNFAGTRAQLAALPGTPIGFQYAYALPANFTRLNFLSRTGEQRSWQRELHYVIEDGQLLCDYTPLYAIYTRDTYAEEYGRWPALFTNAVALDVASRRNRAATQARGEGDRLADRVRMAWRKVRNWDAQQRPWVEKPVGSFVRVRTSGLNGTRVE